MHTCPECGKTMATAGGLAIHIEMVHAAPEPPAPEPPVPEPAQAVAASARARTVPRAAPRPATGDLELPAWLRGWDPTIPLTALMVLGLVLAGVVAAVHRTASGGSGAATIQSAQTAGGGQQAANPAGDQKLAQTLVLDQNDFPDGWTFEPHVHDQADVEADRKLAACLGRPDPATLQTANLYGVDGKGSGLNAGSNVAVLRNQADATRDLDVLFSDKAIPCVKQDVIESLAREGTRVLDVGVGRFSLSTANVRSLGLHFEIAAARGPARALIYADEVVMQQGRVEGLTFFLSFNGRFPPDVEQTLVTRFAHKLANA